MVQPIWKSIPYLAALLVVFLYLLGNRSESRSILYAKVSFALIVAAVPLTILTRLSSVRILGSISFLIRTNLKFAMLLVFIKDILLSRVLENIRHRRLREIALSLALLWVYVSWFFAFLYASPAQELSPIRGRVVSDADPDMDSVNSIDIWYFSVATLTTVGYGDLRPEKACRFVACVEMSFGYFLMSLIIGIVAGVALEYLAEPRERG